MNTSRLLRRPALGPVALALVLVAAPALAADAGEWRQHLAGPSHQSWQRSETLLSPENVGQLEELHVNSDTATEEASSAAVVRGAVYVSSYDSAGSGSAAVSAIDAVTGETRWQTKSALARNTPAVSGGKVYVTGSSELSELDATTGRLLRTRTFPGQVLSTPVLAGTDRPTLYISSYDSRLAGTLRAVDLATLTARWSITSPSFFGIPSVRAGVVYSISGGRLAARRATGGSLLWTSPVAGSGTPILSSSAVFVGGAPNEVCAYRPADGSRLWCTPARFGEVAAYDSAHLYVTENKRLLALSPATGVELWRVELGPGGFARFVSVANGVVYVQVGDEDTRKSLVVLDASSGTELRRILLQRSTASMGAPAVVNGRVYLSGAEGLSILGLAR